MPRQNRDIACPKTWSCVLTPFSVAYTTSISGRQRTLIEFLRMTPETTNISKKQVSVTEGKFDIPMATSNIIPP